MKKIIFIFLLIFNHIQTKNLLIIDTYCDNEYSYHNFIKVAAKLEIKTTYIKFFNLQNIEVENYDVIFLLISPQFMNITNNIIVKNTINKIQIFCQIPNKLLGLIFPNNTISPNQLSNAKLLFKKLNLLNYCERKKLKSIINYFLLINFNKNKPYSTAIESTKKEEVIQEPRELFTDKENRLMAMLLPINETEVTKKCFSTGLYIKNSQNFHIFISKIPALFFNEISENFRVNPINKKMRQKLILNIEQTLIDLMNLIENKQISGIEKINATQDKNMSMNNKFDATRQRNLFINKELYKWAMNGILCGWIDLDAYDDEFLEQGIVNILQSNLNLLWIRFLPELYLSKNAILADKKHEYLEKINKFTKKLKEQSLILNKKLPKIFIGFELTGNYKNNVVNDSMKDICARNFTKIPAPLDFENFWKVELLDVFDEFIKEWNQSIGNGLLIDGIFFDFEMYHAQDQESSFPALSDFSDSAFNTYLKETDQKINLHFTKNRINYLLINNLLDNYFNVLQDSAYALGKKIRLHIKEKLPNAIIGAYLANLPSSWFYIGVLGGLSTKEEPIILASFNNDFFNHFNWFIKNNIFALHLSAILLSKFKDEKSFKLMNYIKQDHDGIWINRFSRLGKKYEDNKWWSNESTPFDHEKIITALSNTLN